MQKMIQLLIAMFIVFSVFCAQAADTSISTWQGTYNFSGSGGREAGGIATFLEIKLALSSSGGCEIIREGYQVQDSMVCSVSKNKDGIDILFKSYPDGKTQNEYGVAVYKSGDRLFSLFPKGNGKTLITDWGKLKPEGYVKKKKYIYFKRVNGN